MSAPQPGQMQVLIEARAWWRLAGVADAAGITVGELLDELSVTAAAKVAADSRAAHEQADRDEVLATIRDRYQDAAVEDDVFLAWLEEVLPA